MKPSDPRPSFFVDFFQFTDNRYWAFKQMMLGPQEMAKSRGLLFFKFLGTGGGKGFSLRPDFGTYAIVTLWDQDSDYHNFTTSNHYWELYRQKASTQRTISMIPVKSHGLWNGTNPFHQKLFQDLDDKEAKVAVLTRATLNWNRLFSFWRSVPKAAKTIETAKGVLYYKGVGEWPWVQQATISIWENFQAVNNYAYRHKGHAEIVKKTRAKKWYKEDLFSRFVVVDDTNYQSINK